MPSYARSSDSLLSKPHVEAAPSVIISFSLLCSSSLQRSISCILVHRHSSVQSLIHIYTTGCSLCLCASLHNIHVCPKKDPAIQFRHMILVCNSKIFEV